MCALAYTEKREVIYTNTIKIEGQEVMFRAFYLSAPDALFEVKLSLSSGTIKWTLHLAVMFGDTLGWFPRKVNGTVSRHPSKMAVRNRLWNGKMGYGARKRENGLVLQLLQPGLL